MSRLSRFCLSKRNVHTYRLSGLDEKENDILKDNDITGSPLFLAIEDQVILGYVREPMKQFVPKKKEVDYTNDRYKHPILGPWLQIENEKD